MIQETAAAAPAAQGTVDVSEDSLRDSLAQVLTALTGRTESAATLSFERMSEDVLYTALMHDQLKREKPALAQALMKTLRPDYRGNLKEMKRQSLSRAVDDFLDKQQRAGKLSKRAVESMTKSAFGRAQLDNSATTLRRKPTDIKLRAPESDKGAVALTLERALANQAATGKSIGAFEQRIEENPILSRRVFNRQKGVLAELYLTTDAKPAATAAGGGSAPISGPLETDTPAELPKASQIETAPTDFVYQPESEKDGLMLVMLPLKFSGTANRVSIHPDGSDAALELKHTGLGNDRRRYFRGESPGNKFGGGAIARIWFTDGTYFDERIADLARFKRTEFP